MKYLALYRKYRPKTFNDVSGQKVIIQTLKNVIKNNKLTHSYLFIGPRGTGKTSVAKIFAKTINCENQIDGCSCEKCSSCISNNNNENIDIIEMDAASNNGVDEIREIKNHITLLPTDSKYKIYIIDEVHMLTTGAFNALLKTLEEPPEHVIFILATTEPHKIPLTIKSRCQSFEFKSIPKQNMIDRLKYICEQENIKIDDESLELIAKNSNGGMRDAISLLDQVNAYSDGNIKSEDIILLNGRISESEIEKLLDFIVDENYEDCFKFIDEIENSGKEFSYICEDVSSFLRKKMLDEQIDNKKYKISKNNIIEIIMILNDCINQMKNTRDKRIYFDLTIMKIFDVLNKKQTNVQISKTYDSDENKKVKEYSKPKKIEEVKEEKQNFIIEDYNELMNIRLNNILSMANKESLITYKKIFEDLSFNVTNLDDLKIVNILNDCKLKAACKNGIVITADNNNILDELYNNLDVIENMLYKLSGVKLFACFLLNTQWDIQREIYVKKIKNKEQIQLIDESKVLEKIKQKKDENKNDFEDLIEIGE